MYYFKALITLEPNLFNIQSVSKNGKNENLANDASGLAFSSTDLDCIFASNVGKEIGAMFRGKRHYKPKVANDFFRMPCRKIYTDLIDYILADHRKAPLLRSFFH